VSRFAKVMKFFVPAMLLAATSLLAGCGGGEESDAVPTITFNTDSIGEQLRITKEMTKQFEEENNCRVEFQIGPDSATERLGEYQKYFAARSGAIDVYQVDVIWPGILADHLLDLSDSIERGAFFEAMIDNSTVDGRLVGVPFYGDAGLLYYRTDLLEKYGFKKGPQTLQELEQMARAIMDGERAAGNDSFWGIVFQGAAFEGLTCNALEWQHGAGGGSILTEGGEIELNNEATRGVLETVRGWVGDVAPEGVLTYKEEESRTIFHSGNAAFMRNWPYAYKLGQAADSPIRDKFYITPFPGSKQAAATLGGWNLAVSKYSRHPDLAKKYVAFLSTRDAQRTRALEGGYFATRHDVYGDGEINREIPYYDEMKEVFLNAVARPSTAAGRSYNEVSAAYYNAVHSILSGKKEAEPALADAEKRIREILDR
jgi:trehalose/maltose transport system substrate-binding protein